MFSTLSHGAAMDFHAHTVVPPLRDDIDIIPFSDNGDSLLALYDRAGYAPEYITLFTAVLPIVEMADGQRSVQDIVREIEAQTAEVLSVGALIELFAGLETAGFLQSERFYEHKVRKDREFLAQTVRPPACAGLSYADNAQELTAFLDKLMQTSSSNCNAEGSAAAVVVPHIDLRVGAESYVPAYRALQQSDAELFVIFGTSHYGWQDLFITTEKHFQTPLGIVQTDIECVRSLREHLPFALHGNDIAHKDEHSIEFQLLFLQHLFRHRTFTVLPILVTSFQPFIDAGITPAQHKRFRGFIDALRHTVEASGKKTAFIASADMAHVGRKFGDEFSAETVLETLAHEDANVLHQAVAADADGFFHCIARANDCRRICGLPPVYSMLEAVRPQRGTLLDYQQWHERETESAVTYASLAYYGHRQGV